ncbi:MAG TPA: hypothetical protein VFV34_18400, partial [Blastocatellia bacterium]|nr:hypothetical protein [Blastocatellia bacterium]
MADYLTQTLSRGAAAVGQITPRAGTRFVGNRGNGTLSSNAPRVTGLDVVRDSAFQTSRLGEEPVGPHDQADDEVEQSRLHLTFERYTSPRVADVSSVEAFNKTAEASSDFTFASSTAAGESSNVSDSGLISGRPPSDSTPGVQQNALSSTDPFASVSHPGEVISPPQRASRDAQVETAAVELSELNDGPPPKLQSQLPMTQAPGYPAALQGLTLDGYVSAPSSR